MTTEYQIYLKSSSGAILDIFGGPTADESKRDFLSLDISRTVKNTGQLKLVIPYDLHPIEFYQPDTILEVWRSVDGGPLYLEGETGFIVRKIRVTLSGDGKWGLELTGFDFIELLDRHIVNYAVGNAFTDKTDYADDMCKDIVRENYLAASPDPVRDLSAWMSVQADLSACPSVAKVFARRNILTTLKEIADQSYLSGTYLAFDVISKPVTGSVSLEFRTYKDYRGNDHRYGVAGAYVILDPEFGTLTDVEMTWDWSAVRNSVVAGGAGSAATRLIETARDTASIGLSPFNLCEMWTDAMNASNSAQVLAEANTILRSYRMRKTFSGRAVDSDAIKYGRDYKFGDYVTAQINGYSFDVHVDSVRISIANGQEQVVALLRSDE